MNEAENPFFVLPPTPDTKMMVKDCLERKNSKPQ
jgi:hypothetical protein